MQAVAFEQTLDRNYELKFISKVELYITETVDENGLPLNVRKKGSSTLKKIYEISEDCEIIMTTRGNGIIVAEAGDKIEILSTENNAFPTAFTLVKSKIKSKSIGAVSMYQFAKINDVHPREL